MSARFAITYDYRCPFARNAHEHVIAALEAGADWDVTFVPFSLGQAKEPDELRWLSPDDDTGLLALQAGVFVRDKDPESFHTVHPALSAPHHNHGLPIREQPAPEDVL